jgi:lipoprotein-anchoring transpeptidase ErfK/SrfK
MPDPARRSGVQAGDRHIDTQLEDRVNKVVAALASIPAMLLLGSNAPPPLPDRAPAPAVVLAQSAALPAGPTAAVQPVEAFAPAIPAVAEPVEPPPPPPPLPPTPEEALQDGVLIVVSLASQRMYVFRDGALWDSSKVSTGKRGNETPVGTFPILQKKVHHRSNLYNDAPMPYMQRLTWGGVALHAGHVPGYPASHGCIRLPKSFAKKLYGITGFSSTLVVVTEERVASAEDALAVA